MPGNNFKDCLNEETCEIKSLLPVSAVIFFFLQLRRTKVNTENTTPVQIVSFPYRSENSAVRKHWSETLQYHAALMDSEIHRRARSSYAGSSMNQTSEIDEYTNRELATQIGAMIAQMNEVMNYAARLETDMQALSEQIATTTNTYDPPPRYSDIAAQAVAVQSPLTTTPTPSFSPQSRSVNIQRTVTPLTAEFAIRMNADPIPEAVYDAYMAAHPEYAFMLAPMYARFRDTPPRPSSGQLCQIMNILARMIIGGDVALYIQIRALENLLADFRRVLPVVQPRLTREQRNNTISQLQGFLQEELAEGSHMPSLEVPQASLLTRRVVHLNLPSTGDWAGSSLARVPPDRVSIPLQMLRLSNSEIFATMTRLFDVLEDLHPEMSIEQERYYVSSLADIMGGHGRSSDYAFGLAHNAASLGQSHEVGNLHELNTSIADHRSISGNTFYLSSSGNSSSTSLSSSASAPNVA